MAQIPSKPASKIEGRYMMVAAWASLAANSSDTLYPDALGNGTPPTATLLAHATSTNSSFDATQNPAGAKAVIRSIHVAREPGTNAAEGNISVQNQDGSKVFWEGALTNANHVAEMSLSLQTGADGFRVARTNGTTKRLSYTIEYDVVGA